MVFIGRFSNTYLLYRDSQQKLTIASFSFILTQISLHAKKMKIHCWKLCFKTIIKQHQYFKGISFIDPSRSSLKGANTLQRCFKVCRSRQVHFIKLKMNFARQYSESPRQSKTLTFINVTWFRLKVCAYHDHFQWEF